MSTALAVPARTALAHIAKGDKLVKEAAELRARVAKADHLEAKAADHYKAAGLIFAKIKVSHDASVDGPWKKSCKKKCGLSWQRVYELIDLGSGKVTLADQRARKTVSMKASNDRRGAERAAKSSAIQSSDGRTSGPNKQLTCAADPRSEVRSRLVNLLIEAEKIADELSDRGRAVFNFHPLATQATRVAAKWTKVASQLTRLSDHERQKAIPQKSAA